MSYIYIMTNKNRTTVYTGVTNNIIRRIDEHKRKINKKCFTARYNLIYCIYFEEFDSIIDAIQREKFIKSMSRAKKDKMINKLNPNWKELTVF